jgi:hypothetical protein
LNQTLIGIALSIFSISALQALHINIFSISSRVQALIVRRELWSVAADGRFSAKHGSAEVGSKLNASEFRLITCDRANGSFARFPNGSFRSPPEHFDSS